MPRYQVKSLETNFSIGYTDSESPGDPVVTQTPQPQIPHHVALKFSRSVSQDRVTPVTITNLRGQYISLDKNTRRLVWSEKSFEWQAAPIFHGAYRFFPKDGEDFYWYQNWSIFPKLGAKPGEELGKDEPIFEVESLEDQ